MKSGVVDTDKGWKAIRKALEPLAKHDAYVKVGVMGDKAEAPHGDKVTNVELAMIHEFGTRDGHIPARAWIRGTFDSHKADYMDVLKRLIGQVYDGKLSLKQALGTVGAKMAADIKKRVKDGDIAPADAPSTAEAKGSDRALIDTGRMVNSVTWDVKPGSEGAHGD
jgi:hypothetical protein